MEQLYKQLEDATVTAPISGTVTAVYAEEGVPGQGLLFVIEDIDHLEISTTIRSMISPRVEVGMPALIRTMTAIDDQDFREHCWKFPHRLQKRRFQQFQRPV